MAASRHTVGGASGGVHPGLSCGFIEMGCVPRDDIYHFHRIVALLSDDPLLNKGKEPPVTVAYGVANT